MKQTEPDVPNANHWFAVTKPGVTPQRSLFIEAERWVDARTAARAVLACEVDIGPALDVTTMPELPAPRVQVKWVGMAARRIPDLRMQIRRIDERRQPGKWEDLR